MYLRDCCSESYKHLNLNCKPECIINRLIQQATVGQLLSSMDSTVDQIEYEKEYEKEIEKLNDNTGLEDSPKTQSPKTHTSTYESLDAHDEHTENLSVHVSKNVVDLLDMRTREWVMNLNPVDLSIILQSVYRIPGVMHSLRSMTASPVAEAQCAAEIGKQGEVTFAKICQALPENYQVVNTAKQGKAGDFIIYYTDGRIKKSCLVDIKKYTTTVPKKELDKFYEDLTFGCYDAGLIISYTTKFSGIHDNIFMEQKDLSYGKIPIMYLANIPDDFIMHAIKIIMMKTIVSADREISSTKLESMLNYINSALAQSSMTRRTLSDLNNSVSSTIQKCQEQLVSLEIQVKRTINEISGLIDTTVAANYAKLKPDPIPARDDNLNEATPLDLTNISEIPPYVEESKELKPIRTLGKIRAAKKNAIDMSKICSKDHPMVKQLMLMEWENVEDMTLENEAITIRLVPMKTKTKVILEQATDGIDELMEMFKPKGDDLQSDLSHTLLDAIEKTFE